MIEVGRVVRTSTAPFEAFFERWIDLPSHPEWAASMEWFDIETPVRVGSRGVSKSTGNEPAPFRVTSLDAPHVYADTTELEGVELTVHHEARPTPAGTRVELRAWLEGPRATEYEAGMREVLAAALPKDLDALIALLERGRAT